MTSATVMRKCLGRENAAFLGEMFEGVAGEEITPHISPASAIDSGHDDQIGVGSNHVERIELNASQASKDRSRRRCPSPAITIQTEVRDQFSSRLGTGECVGAVHLIRLVQICAFGAPAFYSRGYFVHLFET